jgi:hypothetical protein
MGWGWAARHQVMAMGWGWATHHRVMGWGWAARHQVMGWGLVTAMALQPAHNNRRTTLLKSTTGTIITHFVEIHLFEPSPSRTQQCDVV